MADEVRFLGRTTGYVRSSALSPDLLEALGEDDLQELTEQAARKVLDQKIARREATSAELRKEEAFLQSRLRFIGRELRRLSRAA